ncbi:MAG: phosphoesterase [Anaerosolibacter sp.]|uniref:metallophosphoesterase n=1 Tax=Anaerosolibacter sp. TaxID=1872527 RepID=UPI00262686B0|nr:metallophosphoesterase [Anaerosolibacter sp.]MDF2547662.1 phosphoesterase [Anaerosolibacter sp.]
MQKGRRLLMIMLILVLLAVFFYLENNLIEITNQEIRSSKLPKAFDGYTIVHLSDLHNKSFGREQRNLIEKIQKLNPNMIAITGDLIDRRRYNEDPAMVLIQGAVKIAPTYYVTGNHELWSGKFGDFEIRLRNSGVHVLRDKYETIEKENQLLHILGVDDTAKYGRSYGENEERLSLFSEALKQMTHEINEEEFKILLAHRPEKMPIYTDEKVDLVLSGHVHGGQIRMPFLGGIVAPDQGVFPKYAEGVYRDRSTTMVVSRGLGNSIFPQRLFNRPEIVVIKLQREEGK